MINAKNITNNPNLILIIFIAMIIPSFFSKQTKINELIAYNEITIKIKGIGDQKIIEGSAATPNRIYLNGDTQLEGARTIYNLTTEPNIIRMVWDSPLKNCHSMFYGLENILEIDFSKFDSSNVTDMEDMFHRCTSLTSINFSGMNTSLVSSFNYMFFQCNSLKSLDLRSFDTSSVNNMFQMFFECTSLESIDLSSFDTSSVTDMFQTFFGCYALKSLDLSNFNTSSLKRTFQMFLNCFNLETVNLSSFNTKNVVDMQQMFFACHSLKSLDIRNFDTSSVTNMQQMFFECKELKSLDLSSFKTSSLLQVSEMFKDCNALETLDISSFDISSVESLGNLFAGCYSLISLNLSNFDTSNVKYFDNMFNGCKSLENLDISSFVTSSALTTENMFLDCQALQSLDLSHFDTSNVENMKAMFLNCFLLSSLNLTNFSTSKAKNFENMFYGCSKLENLDISNFDTSKVENMNGMFYDCYSLTSLELGNLDTSSVTLMNQMFYNCKSLISLNLNSFITDSVTSYNEMFVNLNISLFCVNNNIKEEIRSQLSFYTEANCSELCISNSQKKYILDKNICINNCNNDKAYIFEYDNVCYGECPNGTHLIDNNMCKKDLICDNYYNYEYTDCLDSIPLGYYLNDTEKKTLGKCNIKCSNCTNDSEIKNLCISCNNSAGYYAKYNDSLTENEFINCYNEQPNGYYLDDEENMYNPCHSSCKACTGKGNTDNHQCSDCFTDYILSNGNCELITEAPTTEVIEVPTTEVAEVPTTEVTEVHTTEVFEAPTTVVTEGPTTEIFSTEEVTEAETTTESSTEEVTEEAATAESSSDAETTAEASTEEVTDEETTSSSITDILTDYKNISDEDTTLITTTAFLPENSHSYNLNGNLTKLKEESKNSTFIYLSEKDIEFLYTIFNLNKEKDKIYAIIVDNEPNDTQTATSDYTYRFFLENKTELNLSKINEDIYVDFHVPITDLEMANFNASKYYSEQGFDIYNKSSEFYNNFCTSAHQGDNDITLKDRKKDIYPNNITLCKSNCKYNGVDIENERVICSCNLNSNGENDTNEEEDFLEEDDGNFITYFIDKVNYKIFKCYELLSSYENLRNNYAFYTILGVFVIILILNLTFCCYSLPTLKKIMLKDAPSNSSVKNDVIQELKKLRKKRSSMKTLNYFPNNPPKKKDKTNKANKKNKIIKTKKINETTVKKKKSKGKIEQLNIKINIKRKFFSTKSFNTKINKSKKKKKTFKTTGYSPSVERLVPKNVADKEDIISMNSEEINDLTYDQALRLDKRSIFRILYSLIIQKFELINLMCNKQQLKVMLISEYILSLLFNFFFNTLLYSDDVVSNKYHNNGELDIIVTLVLSLLSNIITSIVCFYINYSKGIDERSQLIKELKIKKYYLKNVGIFFKYLKLKFICFFISEIILVSGCYYYIVIFCIVYSKSKDSLIINYLTSLLEGLITSTAIIIIILVTRKIGLACLNRYLYNTSKYINNKF